MHLCGLPSHVSQGLIGAPHSIVLPVKGLMPLSAARQGRLPLRSVSDRLLRASLSIELRTS